MRLNRIAVFACAAALIVGCAKPPPEELLDARRGDVDALLAQAHDRDALNRQLDAAAERCVVMTPRAIFCQWRLGNKNAGWLPIAKAIGTRDQVNVLCKLPVDSSRRAPGSCVAFPRRSNRSLYPLPPSTGRRETGAGAVERAEVRERYRREANAAIDAARNLVELSHLVGAAPERCVKIDRRLRHCVWRAGNSSYGHGTLVASVGAEKRKRMRMECRLPRDGSPRARGSCTVEVDG